MAERSRRSLGGLSCDALLWRRTDWHETSRIVVLLTREHGRIAALAKGAHRPTSPMLGCLDFLNDLRIRLSADRGGLRLLLRAELVRERRGLRAPLRYLAASHLVELCDFGFVDGQPDPDLFDLVTGGLTLLERCPEAAVAQVVLGLELRVLAHLGALPDLTHCADCAGALDQDAYFGAAGGLACRQHAPAPRRSLPARALAQLTALQRAAGRQLPELDLGPLAPAAVELPVQWLSRALERRCRLRAHCFRRALAACGPARAAGRP